MFLNAGAFNSVHLLLNSASAAMPHGLANSSGVLGTLIMDHANTLSAMALMPGFEARATFGNRPTGVIIPRYRNHDTHDGVGHTRGTVALYEPFPNSIWNLSVAIASEPGGHIDEIVDMCRPILDAAAQGGDAGTPQFMKQWVAMGEKLIALADEDEANGRLLSASAKLEPASLYLFIAERMQRHDAPGRVDTYARARAMFDKSIRPGQIDRERVEVLLANGTMPTLYTLCVDRPASGKALRLQGLPDDRRSENWASKAVYWLETQPDVDPKRIGMTGISLGGHFVPRGHGRRRGFRGGGEH